MLPALLVGAAICVLASLPAARGSVVAGFLVGRQFAFLGKFCFSWKPTLHEVAGVREMTIHAAACLHRRHRVDTNAAVLDCSSASPARLRPT